MDRLKSLRGDVLATGAMLFVVAVLLAFMP